MIRLRTPTRTVEITMTGVTAEGYDDEIDYSGDYIGNLADPNLHTCADDDCNLSGSGHYHCDDETADWWAEHCQIAESNADRLAGLSTADRATFDAWAAEMGVYDYDIDDTVRSVAAHLDEMSARGTSDEI
jgi:hypothetical protein